MKKLKQMRLPDEGTSEAKKRACGMTPGQVKEYGGPQISRAEYLKKQKQAGQVKEDKAEYDEEGKMMKDQLDIVMDAADEIYDMVDDDDNLPEWCQNKITKAADYIDSVRDYMMSQDKDKDDDDDDEQKEGYVSMAQQRAVWATRKDGGKGHPDNKKKKKKK
ncbi:MAG: hypothetical protein CMO44_13690 [Verrucomicrobiales bacterium]|nr:hypothetical protein [Verrucomicrobiales bacterium]